MINSLKLPRFPRDLESAELEAWLRDLEKAIMAIVKNTNSSLNQGEVSFPIVDYVPTTDTLDEGRQVYYYDGADYYLYCNVGGSLWYTKLEEEV